MKKRNKKATRKTKKQGRKGRKKITAILLKQLFKARLAVDNP